MIPDDVRAELVQRGYDEAWEPSRRQTFLNAYWKLKQHGLWRFVTREEDSGLGIFHFRSQDIAGLRAALAAGNFACGAKRGRWEGSERVTDASLHLKHFDGWPENRVQAHVDRAGAFLHKRWWFFPPVPLVQLFRHWIHYDSYKDVPGLRDLLLRQGAPAWIAV